MLFVDHAQREQKAVRDLRARGEPLVPRGPRELLVLLVDLVGRRGEEAEQRLQLGRRRSGRERLVRDVGEQDEPEPALGRRDRRERLFDAEVGGRLDARGDVEHDDSRRVGGQELPSGLPRRCEERRHGGADQQDRERHLDDAGAADGGLQRHAVDQRHGATPISAFHSTSPPLRARGCSSGTDRSRTTQAARPHQPERRPAGDGARSRAVRAPCGSRPPRRWRPRARRVRARDRPASGATGIRNARTSVKSRRTTVAISQAAQSARSSAPPNARPPSSLGEIAPRHRPREPRDELHAASTARSRRLSAVTGRPPPATRPSA